MPETPDVTTTPTSTPAPAPTRSTAAPIGAEAVKPQTSGSGATTPVPGSAHGAATPFRVTDDTLMEIPGQDQPITWKELNRRQQADYTRKTQDAARKLAEADKREKEWTARKAQEEASLRTTAAALLARGQGQNQGPDFFATVEKMPYVDGKTIAGVLRTIQQDGFGGVVKAFESRDTIIKGLYDRVKQMESTINQLSGVHQDTSFNTKLSGWMKELDMPEELGDWAKEVYLAYEPGEELDNAFPEILKNRWAQAQAAMRKREQARVESSRTQAFPLPGKGSGASAARAIPNLTGRESSREITDMIWDKLHAESAT